MRTLHDIYRCPECGFIAAHGNHYCRNCGIQFSPSQIDTMQADPQPVFKGLPWNLRDIYRCVHCSEHIALSDSYCRGCGDQIDDHEKQLMKLKMSELANKNSPSLIWLALMVIGIVGFFLLL